METRMQAPAGALASQSYGQYGAVRLTIVGAQGLYSVSKGAKLDAFGTCELLGKQHGARVRTPGISGTPEPLWNTSLSIEGFVPGDTLLFQVFHKDPDMMDELIGRAELPSAQFVPHGFEGTLNLSLPLASHSTQATVHVAIPPVQSVGSGRELPTARSGRYDASGNAALNTTLPGGIYTRPPTASGIASPQPMGSMAELGTTQHGAFATTSGASAFGQDVQPGSGRPDTAHSLAASQSAEGVPQPPISRLFFRVNAAHNLVNKDTGMFGDFSDPFVVVKIGDKMFKTPVIKNNLNPVWTEGNQFSFEVADDQHVVELEVMNSNMFKDDSLGTASVDLHKLQTKQWAQLALPLLGAKHGAVDVHVFFDPTEHYELLFQLENARLQLGTMDTKVAAVKRRRELAAYASQWLEDIDSNVAMPLSIEEKAWQQACSGRNLVIPVWLTVKRTAVDTSKRDQQSPIVALFPEVSEQSANVKAKVTVMMLSAQGLRSLGKGDKPDAYCVCEVRGKPQSRVQTVPVQGTANPEWKRSQTIKGYANGDALVFAVFDRGIAYDASATGSASRRPDEMIGATELPAARFYPNGFDGLLTLYLNKEDTKATLRVMVLIVD